ncbi:MAG: hypothetical protein HRT35_16815 [Algicola sp.]|nr:hypothetical protein [Algicola sp.]
MSRFFKFLICLLACTQLAHADEGIDCPATALSLDKIYQHVEQIDQQRRAMYKNHISGTMLVDNRPAQFNALYKQCLVGKEYQLQKLTSEQLQRLFRAIYKVVFYAANVEAAEQLLPVLAEKIRRGEKVEANIDRLHRVYVKTRQFDRANDLERKYPEIEFSEIPAIVDTATAGRSMFQVQPGTDKGQQQLVRKPFAFAKGGQVIVISTPICNPCKRMLTWLQTQPELMQVMAEHSVWMASVSGNLYWQDIVQTNIDYAPIEMRYAYAKSDWPEIKYWATPTFYFYMDGKLVKQVSGWGRKENGEKLKAGLKLIGLLPS